MYECYRCRKMTQVGDRWTYLTCESPDVVVDDTPKSIFLPKIEEHHYHKQCVPLNLARTENNYTPG